MHKKRKIWRGREVIEPNATQHPLTWVPEPFFADITGNGIVPHAGIEVPNARVFIAATIPFDRHAQYFAGGE